MATGIDAAMALRRGDNGGTMGARLGTGSAIEPCAARLGTGSDTEPCESHLVLSAAGGRPMYLCAVGDETGTGAKEPAGWSESAMAACGAGSAT
mmetsp:Transcript_32512/g.82863  ORF Transcript_32512/g.82863 Transcript_32512/m.82863 type:complete len:94 (-) Transcript_32512:28-309(-)